VSRIDGVAQRVAKELLREPEVVTTIQAAPPEARDSLEEAMIATVTERAAEASERDEEAAALHELEERLQSALDSALNDRADASPEAFKTRGGIAELQRIQDRLAEEERMLRETAAGIRAELLTMRGELAARADGPSKSERRQLEDLERRYLGQVEALQEKRRSIADVVTSKKRLQLALPSAERDAREAILSQPGPLREMANEVDAKRASMVSRRVEELRPHLSEFVAMAGSSGALDEEPPVRADAPGGQDHLGLSGDEGKDTELALRRRILELKQSATARRSRAQQGVIGAVVSIMLLPIPVIFADGTARFVAVVYLGVLSAVLLSITTLYHQRVRSLSEDLADAQNELDLLRIEHDHPERRALKMLQVNQLDLRRYYDQTLRQGRLVFYLGIACIALGFAAVGGALLLVSTQAATSEEQIIVASLGAVPALLANFIGVIYLKMFSEITGSVGAFHTRLVGTHDLYFGNFLAAKVEDEARREALFADLVNEVGHTRNAYGVDGTTSG
jgi:hypothetical protein